MRGVAYGVVDRLQGASGGQYFGKGMEAGVAQASPDAVYWYLSLPASGATSGGTARQVAVAALHAFESISNPIACYLRNAMIRAIPESIILRSLVAIGRPPSMTDGQ